MFVRIESPNAWAESQIRMRLSSPMLTPSRTFGDFWQEFQGIYVVKEWNIQRTFRDSGIHSEEACCIETIQCFKIWNG